MEARNRTAKNLRDTELNDLRSILETPQGRRHLWRELVQSGIHVCNFTGNSTVYFNEGMRFHGLWLEGEIKEASMDKYLLMVKEGHNITKKEKEEE